MSVIMGIKAIVAATDNALFMVIVVYDLYYPDFHSIFLPKLLMKESAESKLFSWFSNIRKLLFFNQLIIINKAYEEIWSRT